MAQFNTHTVAHVARTGDGQKNFNTLVPITEGYPYLLLFPGSDLLNEADSFILETSDGSYLETLTVAEAQRSPLGHLILWFPHPPLNSRCDLRFEPASPGPNAQPYYIFRDQPATYRSSE